MRLGSTVVLLSLVALLLLLPAVAARPAVAYAVHTPRGLRPGDPVTVSAVITVTKNAPSGFFIALYTVPVILEEDTLEDVSLLIIHGMPTELLTSLLRGKVYSGVWDTYGYAIPLRLREPGTYNMSITVRVPRNAACGETLFIFIAYWVDEESEVFSIPLGVVCEDKLRRGIYYEDYVKQLRDENTLLSSQVTRLEAELRGAYYERDSLKQQMAQLQQQLSQLQGENEQLKQQVKQLQSENHQLRQQLDAVSGENQRLQQLLSETTEAAQHQQRLLYLLAALAAGLVAALATLALRRRG